jgi:hypothetical protein
MDFQFHAMMEEFRETLINFVDEYVDESNITWEE